MVIKAVLTSSVILWSLKPYSHTWEISLFFFHFYLDILSFFFYCLGFVQFQINFQKVSLWLLFVPGPLADWFRECLRPRLLQSFRLYHRLLLLTCEHVKPLLSSEGWPPIETLLIILRFSDTLVHQTQFLPCFLPRGCWYHAGIIVGDVFCPFILLSHGDTLLLVFNVIFYGFLVLFS